MSIKILLDGVGKIGTKVLKEIYTTSNYSDIELLGITDKYINLPSVAVDRLNRETAYPMSESIQSIDSDDTGNQLILNGKNILFQNTNATSFPAGEFGVDYLLDCTRFWIIFILEFSYIYWSKKNYNFFI